MDVVAVVALKGLIGGVLVVVFALLCEVIGPRSFSGVFGAAPSIALASLLVTVAAEGVDAGRLQSFSMIFAAFAMVAYCATAVVTVDRFGALHGSVFAFVSWVVVAALAYGVAVALGP